MSTSSGPTQLVGRRRATITPRTTGNRLNTEPTANRVIGWSAATAMTPTTTISITTRAARTYALTRGRAMPLTVGLRAFAANGCQHGDESRTSPDPLAAGDGKPRMSDH